MTSEQATVGIVMPLGIQVGGAEGLLGHLLRHDAQRFKYVCAFLEDGPLVSELRALGYDVEVFPTTHLSDVKNYAKTVLALRSWLKVKRPIVALSWMSKGHLYLGMAALLLPTKVMWFQHSVPQGTAYVDRLITLIPAAGILCCSNTSKAFQDRLLPHRAAYVCYPGVSIPPLKALSVAEARVRLGLPPRSIVVGMVARLERWKGAHIFVEASKFVIERYPDATLFVVGGPHALAPAYSEEIQKMVDSSGYGSQFILAGQRTMDEALMWQTAADVIVHPVTGIEPFGMAVVEAMARGKVVVTSKVGGPAEIIRDGIDGVLINSNDPVLLGETLNALLEDPERRSNLERNAVARGRSFSIPTFTDRFGEIVQGVIDRRD